MEDTKALNPITFQSEPLFSRIKRGLFTAKKNITIEPVIFFMTIVEYIDLVTIDQLVIDKSCRLDFNYTAEVCDNLVETAYEDENTEVQNEVAQYKVYESLAVRLFPIVMSFYLGSWGDMFGRKLILYIYMSAKLFEGIMLIVNTQFENWPKEYLLFSVRLPVALSGGEIAYHMGINSFVAAISKPEQRTVRLGLMHLVYAMGRPIGTLFGAYLFQEGSYMCVFGTTTVGRIIGFSFLIYTFESYDWTKEENRKEGETKKYHLFSYRHIVDSLKTATKPRPNRKRFYLWMYLTMLISLFLPLFGEMVVGYNYVRTLYQWEVVEYSQYKSFQELLEVVGQGVAIPILGWLNFRDSAIVPVLFFTYILRDVIKAFSKFPWMLYTAAAVGFVAAYSVSTCRSIMSKCVENDELGKVFALLSSLESIVPIVMSQVYASLWEATSDLNYPWVGTVYMLSAVLISISTAMSLYALYCLKGQTVEELGQSEPTEPKYRKSDGYPATSI